MAFFQKKSQIVVEKPSIKYFYIFLFMLEAVNVSVANDGFCKLKNFELYGLGYKCYNYATIPKLNFIKNNFTVKALDLSDISNTLKILPREAFLAANFSDLQFLDLGSCEIAKIEVSAFKELHKLNHLKLDSNYLTDMDPDEFKNLHQLENLDLNYNPKLEFSYTSEFPASLKNLKILTLDLRSVSPNLFKNLPNLETLTISWGSISEKDLGIITQIKSLKKLTLISDNIEVFDLDIFKNMENLQDLDLRRNPLRWNYKRETKFPPLNLIALNLDRCELEFISPGLFLSLDNLQELDLYANYLTIDDLTKISDIKSLKRLDFGGNKLRSFDPDLFKDLKNLEWLDLRDNLLWKFAGFERDPEFPKLNLKWLGLDNCGFEAIPVNLFHNLEVLEELHLSYNHISEENLEGVFVLKGLKILHLSNNRLSNADPIIFKPLTNLQSLYLNRNNLQGFTKHDAQFPKMKLIKLMLNECKLWSLGANLFKNLANLEMLSLSENLLTSKDLTSISSLKTLENLRLDYNRIAKLDLDVFKGLRNLKEIWLSHNPLKFQENSTFPELPQLKNLYMEYCELTSIPRNLFKNLKNLENLSLSVNKLTTLDWKFTIRPLQNLKELWLRWNPWLCDCNANAFLTHLDKKNIDFGPFLPKDQSYSCSAFCAYCSSICFNFMSPFLLV